MMLLKSNTRIARKDRSSKALVAERDSNPALGRSREYLRAVGNVCLTAAQQEDWREVAAALDTLRLMPLFLRNLEASI